MIHSDGYNQLLQRLLQTFPMSEARYALRCLTEDLLNKNTIETHEDECRLNDAVNELIRGVPLQYVTGVSWFFKMKFHVNNKVLIPRPETEELVEWVLDLFDDEPLKVLDIGTGSGCIAVALKRMRQSWNVEACDISRNALVVAQKNAALNHADVKFFEMDVTKSDTGASKKYDLIISNPPYIALDEAPTMNKNVTEHEPHTALFAPANDPLFFYKAIVSFAGRNLNPGGSVFAEINQNKADETFECFVPYFRYVEMRMDLSGNFRMLYASGLKNHPSEV